VLQLTLISTRHGCTVVADMTISRVKL